MRNKTKRNIIDSTMSEDFIVCINCCSFIHVLMQSCFLKSFRLQCYFMYYCMPSVLASNVCTIHLFYLFQYLVMREASGLWAELVIWRDDWRSVWIRSGVLSRISSSTFQTPEWPVGNWDTMIPVSVVQKFALVQQIL